MAQYKRMWDVADISFEIVSDMTDDPVVTLLVQTPAGQLTFTAEPVENGDTLVARGTHVQDASTNAIGTANLMVIAQALMERMGYDGLVVEGALRTTGANPGRRPRPIRFTRHVRPALTQGPRAP
jgi:NADH dehydrogenase FAD-containing subunit